MVNSIRFSALLLLAIGAVQSTIAQEAPANDQCDSAIEVTTFPFTDSGSFANATLDTFNVSCGDQMTEDSGVYVWYVFPDLSEGTELQVSISGINAEVQGEILVSNDELGSCPDSFLCPEGPVSAMSSINSSGSTGSSISVSVLESDAIYYLVLYTTSTSGAEYEVSFNVAEISTASTTAVTTEAQEPPPNNFCESATEVTTFPFTDSGSFANATEDSLNIECYGGWDGIDVWYVLPDVSEGTEYEVSMFGIGGEVQGWVLKSNNELGTCPEEFLCPETLTATSSIDPSGSTQSRLIFTAEKDSFYYVALYTTSNSTAPDYEISVEALEPVPGSVSTPAPAPADTADKSSGFKMMIGSVGAALVSMSVLLFV
ncbi:hypothetical protein ACHAWU_003646 [Discostella pseudostelligera]|uniref:Uncharacterized protein n=1 Tax=Discostella pseudostelligera TaxID=259834 RepID=A0ABD3MAC7_9STRA